MCDDSNCEGVMRVQGQLTCLDTCVLDVEEVVSEDTTSLIIQGLLLVGPLNGGFGGP